MLRRRIPALAAALLLLPTLGCVQGHRALRASHAHHNAAVQTRIDEELLLNLVRLRYRDAPLFLRVGSIVTQFEFRVGADADATLNEGGADTLGLGAEIGISEQPTFTFTPLQDEAFVKRLLEPVDPLVLAVLQRSGWSIERVMRMIVQQLGSLDNATSASGPTPDRPPSYEGFRRVAGALRALQEQRAVELGYELEQVALGPALPRESVRAEDLLRAVESGYDFREEGPALRLVEERRVPVLRIARAARQSPAAQELVATLGLQPGLARYELVREETFLPELMEPEGQRRRISVSMRSLLGTLFYLSHAVEIPEDHVARGWVTRTLDASGRPFDWTGLSEGLLRVRCSERRPEDAAVRVPYRGHWFSIAQDDLDSKSTFMLLSELFSLQSGQGVDGAPVLTIPVGN